LRLTIYDLRFEEPTRAACPAEQVVNRKSGEGRWSPCHANRSLDSRRSLPALVELPN
jgi:hypothetical protein